MKVRRDGNVRDAQGVLRPALPGGPPTPQERASWPGEAPAKPVNEALIQRDILRSFEDPALWGDVSIKRTHPVNATEHSLRGGVYSSRRIQAGERGQSDLTGYLRVSLSGVTLCSAVLGMEVKTSTGRVEPHQWDWLDAAERQGWYVAVVRSVEDAQALVKLTRRALRAGLGGDLEKLRAIRAELRAPLDAALARRNGTP